MHSPSFCPPLLRIALNLQYNGSNFHGWESKPNLPTIQSTLSKALSQITHTSIKPVAASRTDAGTHALSQIVHFDTSFNYSQAAAWKASLNKHLPSDIQISAANFTSFSFNARKSAAFRSYRYSIFTNAQPSVFVSPFVWHYYQRGLDTCLMNQAIAYLVNDRNPHDLSAFRKRRASASHTTITVFDAAVHTCGPFVYVDVTADWFVYGMMRLLVATLVQVGTGNMSVQQFARIVREKDRSKVLFSAPASGLCLNRVGYPAELDPFPALEQQHRTMFFPVYPSLCEKHPA